MALSRGLTKCWPGLAKMRRDLISNFIRFDENLNRFDEAFGGLTSGLIQNCKVSYSLLHAESGIPDL